MGFHSGDFGDFGYSRGHPGVDFGGSGGSLGKTLDQPCGYLEALVPTWVPKNAARTEKKGCLRSSMKKYRKSTQNERSKTTKIIVL